MVGAAAARARCRLGGTAWLGLANAASRGAGVPHLPRAAGACVDRHPMTGLGELEAAVMAVLWRSPEPLRVRDVQERLTKRRPLAYTTVMTVLHNLHRKGWVVRRMDGRAYRYRASRG